MPDPGPADPHERGTAHLELPAVGGGLRRALVHAGVLARLRPRASLRGDPRLPEAIAPVRQRRRRLVRNGLDGCDPRDERQLIRSRFQTRASRYAAPGMAAAAYRTIKPVAGDVHPDDGEDQPSQDRVSDDEQHDHAEREERPSDRSEAGGPAAPARELRLRSHRAGSRCARASRAGARPRRARRPAASPAPRRPAAPHSTGCTTRGRPRRAAPQLGQVRMARLPSSRGIGRGRPRLDASWRLCDLRFREVSGRLCAGSMEVTPAAASSDREKGALVMTDLMEAVTSLAKRRGIAFQSSEIYGGLALVLGLRPARGRDPPEHPQRVVALDGPAARRDRGPGGGDHHVAQGVGGVRPRRRLLRPARRVRELPSPVPRGSPAGAARLPELRRNGVQRVEAVQPDVQDAHGAGATTTPA